MRAASACLLLMLLSCATLPPPRSQADEARNSEARFYQTFGGIMVAGCVTTVLSGGVAAAAVADANADPTIVLVATGLGAAVSCIAGGYLIRTGNELVAPSVAEAPRKATTRDQPEEMPATF